MAATTTAKKPSTTTRKAAAAKKAPAAPASQDEAQKKPAPKAAPKKAAKPEAPAPTTLLEALTAGQARLVKERGNGTLRSLPYLAPGTTDRAQAETVAARNAGGEAITAIALDLKVSLATARRFLTNLALAQAVEAGQHDATWTPGTKDVVVHTVVMKASSK